MKRIQYDSYGGPETMELEAFELKAPGTGEVAVKVKFAAINPIDWKVRNGYLKMVTGRKFPRAMGSDFSGIVTAVGAGVTRFKIGDPVFGMAQIKHGGALGEAVIAPQTFVARRPDSVSFEDAACLATPGVTAWNGGQGCPEIRQPGVHQRLHRRCRRGHGAARKDVRGDRRGDMQCAGDAASP